MRDENTVIRHGTVRNGLYFLETEALLPATIDEVFAFFANAENLEPITPPELAFRILTPTPIVMGEGTTIDYRLQLFGVPFRWRTLITQWQPNSQFRDEQVRGPYRQWEHLHLFSATADGTHMTDRVEYRLPFQPAGIIALPIVRRQLDHIFRYRADVMRELLE